MRLYDFILRRWHSYRFAEAFYKGWGMGYNGEAFTLRPVEGPAGGWRQRPHKLISYYWSLGIQTGQEALFHATAHSVVTEAESIAKEAT